MRTHVMLRSSRRKVGSIPARNSAACTAPALTITTHPLWRHRELPNPDTPRAWQELWFKLRPDFAGMETDLRRCLGRDFVSVTEFTSVVPGMEYSPDVYSELMSLLPPAAWFRERARPHTLLVPGPPKPLSLAQLQTRLNAHIREAWVQRHHFAYTETVRPGWYALCKQVLPASPNCDLDAQCGLLRVGERLPNAAEMVWCLLIYRLMRKERLFMHTYARTASLPHEEPDMVVTVGGHQAFLSVRKFEHRIRRMNIGITSLLCL